MNPFLPDSSTQPDVPALVILPGILTLVGVLLYVYGRNREKDDGVTRFKWMAFIPLALAIITAYPAFARVMLGDPAERNMYVEDVLFNSRKLLVSIYGAFLIPAALTVAFLVWHVVDQKMSKYR
jgi:hypothetical protein